jgi:trehalose 6-phosphate synthase/phosphatase
VERPARGGAGGTEEGGETAGGWWTQKRERDRRGRSGRTGSGGSGVTPGAHGVARREALKFGAEAGKEPAAAAAAEGEGQQESERIFTCTVGRKRSQARYFLNDSEEVAALLEDLSNTLGGAPLTRIDSVG